MIKLTYQQLQFKTDQYKRAGFSIPNVKTKNTSFLFIPEDLYESIKFYNINLGQIQGQSINNYNQVNNYANPLQAPQDPRHNNLNQVFAQNYDLNQDSQYIFGQLGEDTQYGGPDTLTVSDGVSSTTFSSLYLSDLLSSKSYEFSQIMEELNNDNTLNQPNWKKAVLLRYNQFIKQEIQDFQTRQIFTLLKNNQREIGQYQKLSQEQKDTLLYDNLNLFADNQILDQSSTVVSAYLINNFQNPDQTNLFIIEKGDSLTLIFKLTKINFGNQTKWCYLPNYLSMPLSQAFNTPLQFLAQTDKKIMQNYYTGKQEIKTLKNDEDLFYQTKYDGQLLLEKVQVHEGDIVIVASDGVYDNQTIGYFTFIVNLMMKQIIEENKELDQNSVVDYSNLAQYYQQLVNKNIRNLNNKLKNERLQQNSAQITQPYEVEYQINLKKKNMFYSYFADQQSELSYQEVINKITQNFNQNFSQLNLNGKLDYFNSLFKLEDIYIQRFDEQIIGNYKLQFYKKIDNVTTSIHFINLIFIQIMLIIKKQYSNYNIQKFKIDTQYNQVFLNNNQKNVPDLINQVNNYIKLLKQNINQLLQEKNQQTLKKIQEDNNNMQPLLNLQGLQDITNYLAQPIQNKKEQYEQIDIFNPYQTIQKFLDKQLDNLFESKEDEINFQIEDYISTSLIGYVTTFLSFNLNKQALYNNFHSDIFSQIITSSVTSLFNPIFEYSTTNQQPDIYFSPFKQNCFIQSNEDLQNIQQSRPIIFNFLGNYCRNMFKRDDVTTLASIVKPMNKSIYLMSKLTQQSLNLGQSDLIDYLGQANLKQQKMNQDIKWN